MSKNEYHSPVTTMEELHRAQRANKMQIIEAAGRFGNSLQAFQSSLTIGNIFLQAINGGAGIFRGLALMRKGYRMARSIFDMLRRDR